MLKDAFNPIYNKIDNDTRAGLKPSAMIIVEHQYLIPPAKNLENDGFFNSILNYQDTDVIRGVTEEIIAWALSEFSINKHKLRHIDGITRNSDFEPHAFCHIEDITPPIMKEINYIVEYICSRYRVPISPADEWSNHAKRIFSSTLNEMYLHWHKRMTRLLPTNIDITSLTNEEVGQVEPNTGAYWLSHLDIDLYNNKIYGFYLIN